MGTEQQTSGQSCPFPGEGADKKEEEGPMNTDPRVHPALTGFLNSLTARNVSQNTRIAYQTDLTQFFTWLLENDVTVSAPTHVSRGHILEYLACLAHQGRSGVSRARKLAAIREYFKDLIAEELLSASPAVLQLCPRKSAKAACICVKMNP